MASDVTVQKDLFEQTLGFGTRERVVDFTAGVEIGVWMSVNILGHEMAIMADSTGIAGAAACTTSPSGTACRSTTPTPPRA